MVGPSNGRFCPCHSWAGMGSRESNFQAACAQYSSSVHGLSADRATLPPAHCQVHAGLEPDCSDLWLRKVASHWFSPHNLVLPSFYLIMVDIQGLVESSFVSSKYFSSKAGKASFLKFLVTSEEAVYFVLPPLSVNSGPTQYSL